jgi:hypothetical protein
MDPENQLAGRVAQLEREAREAPLKFAVTGLIAGGGIGAVVARGASTEVFAAIAVGGGLLGLGFGLWQRTRIRRRLRLANAMLDRVERHSR